MALRKYGTGKILRDDEEQAEAKIAAKHFTEADRKALAEEQRDSLCRHVGQCKCDKPLSE